MLIQPNGCKKLCDKRNRGVCMELTGKIANWIYERKRKPFPDEELIAARWHIADTMGCIISGSLDLSSQKLSKYVTSRWTAGGIPLLFNANAFVRPDNAALYYGFCAQVDDCDDLSLPISIHSSAVVWPVVLALGTALHATDEECQKAYIIGMETADAIGRGLAAADYFCWNQTTLLGILASTAATATLLDLSVEEIIAALGIAAGEASGLKVNYGSNAKDISVGNTPAKAILAGNLAKAGFSGNKDALGSEKGLFVMLDSEFDKNVVWQAFKTIDSEFFEKNIIIKPYPASWGIHNAVDGILDIKQKHNISMENIKDITCMVQNTVYTADLTYLPSTAVEAKFSLPYCVALAVKKGFIGVEDFSENKELDPEILNFAKRIRIVQDSSFDCKHAKSGTEVRIVDKSNNEYTYRGYYAKGDPRNPLSKEEVLKKIKKNMGRRLGPEDTEDLLKMIFSPSAQGLKSIFRICND